MITTPPRTTINGTELLEHGRCWSPDLEYAYRYIQASKASQASKVRRGPQKDYTTTKTIHPNGLRRMGGKRISRSRLEPEIA